MTCGNPALKGKLSAPADFDPFRHHHGGAPAVRRQRRPHGKRDRKLKALKPNFKAFYTNDANSQQLIATGETPVQILLSMNAYDMMPGVPIKVVMPKEGAVLGIDTMGIMKAAARPTWPTNS